MMALSACEITDTDKENIDDAFNPPVVDLPDDNSTEKEFCEVERHVQPEAEVIKKLDLVFVVDTSGSINQERTGIANGINAFVAELPDDINLQVGVMYAHGEEKNNAEPYAVEMSGGRFGGCLQSEFFGVVLGAAKAAAGKRARSCYVLVGN